MSPGSGYLPGEATDAGPVTVVISQPIKPGRRDDVRRWQDTINRAVAMFPGYLGNDISVLEDEGGAGR